MEDDQNDAWLVRRALGEARIQCELRVVDNRGAFEAELERDSIDLILSDFSLPNFDGMQALAMAKARRPQTPFIFVSGHIGEEAAVESLRNGASDYLVKDRMARLPAAVTRAIEEADERLRRAQAEAALIEREELFTAFMDFSPSLAFLKTEDGRMVYANKPLQRWFSDRGQEWRGKKERDYLPEEAAAMVREHDLQVLRTNTPLQTTEAIPEPDGTIRHWLVCKFPLSARGGERLVGGIAFDVTEQRNLERQLLRAQRMESLGILAGGIAHDLNNVLLPVSLGVEVLRETAAGPLEADVLNVMQVSTTRASGLIRQVLTFARGATDEKLVINPAHVLRDVVAIARRTFSPAISISSEISPAIATIEADPTQLHQVLLNLAVNARDAMAEGGKLWVRALNVSRSEVRDHFGGKPDAAEYILIEVADTGTGIPEALRDRIFEPFFTTKEVGKGTGLGLSTSLGIIKNHSGFIDFSSSAAGTTFFLYLPASRDAAAMETRAPQAKDLTGGAEVVLIIDDEVGAREIAKAVLGRNAYQVLTATNGVEGLATFRRFIDRIHVVLIDHRMPLMDGPDAVREIRQASATVKIIGMSGHAPTAGAEFVSAGADAFLGKPFTADQLLSLIQGFLRPQA